MNNKKVVPGQPSRSGWPSWRIKSELRTQNYDMDAHGHAHQYGGREECSNHPVEGLRLGVGYGAFEVLSHMTFQLF